MIWFNFMYYLVINSFLKDEGVEVPVVLVGNKKDLAGDRMVSWRETWTYTVLDRLGS